MLAAVFPLEIALGDGQPALDPRRAARLHLIIRTDALYHFHGIPQSLAGFVPIYPRYVPTRRLPSDGLNGEPGAGGKSLAVLHASRSVTASWDRSLLAFQRIKLVIEVIQ